MPIDSEDIDLTQIVMGGALKVFNPVKQGLDEKLYGTVFTTAKGRVDWVLARALRK